MRGYLVFLVCFGILFLPACKKKNTGNQKIAQKDLKLYYQNINAGNPAKLREQLYKLIRKQKKLKYSKLWKAIAKTDQINPGNKKITLFYTGWSIPSENQARGKDAHRDDYWNREHVWPKSHGQFGTKPGPGTDLHHLRASDRSVNRVRGNLDFDEGGAMYKDPDGQTNCRFDRDSFEPRKEVKGDVARMLFYMAVRYEGDKGEPDLELADKITPGTKKPILGRLSTLLKWHKQDPVDQTERRRHEIIFKIQGNRNPFIDHPEWVSIIWGQ